MLPRQVLLAVLAALSVSALPLNINLGAYSPALVVGDGEISFGNAERAGEVMETLASGAAVAGNANGQAAPPAEGGQQAPPPAEGEASSPSPATPPERSRIRYHATPDLPALTEKRDVSSVTTSTSLLKPREPSKLIARDINGFREALNYAREAMKNQPKVELGDDAAGVGIIQNAGVNVQANSAANGAEPNGGEESGPLRRLRQKREITPPVETDEKAGITLLAIAEI